MIGWIKLHKKFIEWGWFHKSEMVHLFIYFLLKANHKPRYFEGHLIKTGSFVTGRNKIHSETGISSQTIRTCIERLKSTNEITIKSTKRFSIITINNYNAYQSKESETNQVINQVTNQQLTNNQPTTNHNIRIKELKNEKNIKEQYLELVFLTSDQYQKLIDKFGKPITEDYIERLNNYGHNKPKEFKKYNSHYHTILNWQRKDEKEKPNHKTFKGDF